MCLYVTAGSVINILMVNINFKLDSDDKSIDLNVASLKSKE